MSQRVIRCCISSQGAETLTLLCLDDFELIARCQSGVNHEIPQLSLSRRDRRRDLAGLPAEDGQIHRGPHGEGRAVAGAERDGHRLLDDNLGTLRRWIVIVPAKGVVVVRDLERDGGTVRDGFLAGHDVAPDLAARGAGDERAGGEERVVLFHAGLVEDLDGVGGRHRGEVSWVFSAFQISE